MKKLFVFGLVVLLEVGGCSDDQDTGLCGNNTIDEGETCDGNCPEDCDDGDDCTSDILTGSAQNCNVDCSHEAIVTCRDGDGCCPAGCNANGDADCSSSCGNGEIEEGETCDPPATCPADCIDGDACTEDLMTGSPANCNVVCSNPVITECRNGDACCPQGCAAVNDDDCGGGEVDCRFDPKVTWSIVGEILQMESADSGTCVWLKRKNECPPGWICMANPFTLEQVRIGHDGRVTEYDGSNADLAWTASHHNWSDVGRIDTGTTLYTLTAQNYGQAYEITASGGESWGPVLLEPWEP